VSGGEQRSRGVEFDLSGEIAPVWDMFFTASRIDAQAAAARGLNGIARWLAWPMAGEQHAAAYDLCAP
jgi:outer membrane receptor for ferric coprogen and ferric-rhodotorulic acid